MLLCNLYKTIPNSGRMGDSRRLNDPLDALLLQLAINLLFIPTHNRLSQVSVGSDKISAPLRPNLFRWSSSTYELAENHDKIICVEWGRSHLLKHQKIREGICRLLCCRSGWTCDKTANSCFHSFQRHCKSTGIRSSHPIFSFHSGCKIFLASRTTGQTNPMGSYSELTADRIPRLVGGWWGSWTLNKKASFSTSHGTPSVLSTGRFSRSESRGGFARSASGILDSTSQQTKSDQISLGGPLLLMNWRRIMIKSSVSSEGVAIFWSIRKLGKGYVGRREAALEASVDTFSHSDW